MNDRNGADTAIRPKYWHRVSWNKSVQPPLTVLTSGKGEIASILHDTNC